MSQALGQPVMFSAVDGTFYQRLEDMLNSEISATLTAVERTLRQALENKCNNVTSAALTHQLKSSQDDEEKIQVLKGHFQEPSTIPTNFSSTQNYSICIWTNDLKTNEESALTERSDSDSKGFSQLIKKEEMAFTGKTSRDHNISSLEIKKEEITFTERGFRDYDISSLDVKKEEIAFTERSNSGDNFSYQGIKKEEMDLSADEMMLRPVKREQSIINELVPFKTTYENEPQKHKDVWSNYISSSYEQGIYPSDKKLQFAQIKLTRLCLPDKVVRKQPQTSSNVSKKTLTSDENISIKECILKKEKIKRKQKRYVDEMPSEENEVITDIPSVSGKEKMENDKRKRQRIEEIGVELSNPTKKNNKMKRLRKKKGKKTRKAERLVDPTKPCLLSDELSNVVGGNIMTRKEISAQVWMYAKERDLVFTIRTKTDKFIKCNYDLFKIFDKKFIAYQSMRRFVFTLNSHITELD